MQSTVLSRLGLTHEWARETVMAGLLLAMGFGLMPFLIFQAGSLLLGRYDGASADRLYDSIYRGLGEGSTAAWIVVFGPYGLYLITKGLRFWWRAGTETA